VLTVGAMNDGGDLDPSNDDVPAWSSRGPTAAGAAKPDLVTPGRTLVAQRSRGSQVEADNPKALVSGDYVRGSGTSQAGRIAARRPGRESSKRSWVAWRLRMIGPGVTAENPPLCRQSSLTAALGPPS